MSVITFKTLKSFTDPDIPGFFLLIKNHIRVFPGLSVIYIEEYSRNIKDTDIQISTLILTIIILLQLYIR